MPKVCQNSRSCATIVRFSQRETTLWFDATFTITMRVDQLSYCIEKENLFNGYSNVCQMMGKRIAQTHLYAYWPNR